MKYHSPPQGLAGRQIRLEEGAKEEDSTSYYLHRKS